MHDIISYMILNMISCMISYMILDMISYMKMYSPYFLCLAAADPRQAQRVNETDDYRDPDRPMDFDKERDYADQGPLTDMDMKEDTEILSLLRPTPTIRIRWNSSTSRPISTLRGTAWCGMRALNSSSTAPCVRQASRRLCTVVRTGRCP
jgi:hypothetical protein